MAAALVTAALSHSDKTEPWLGSAERRDFVLDRDFYAANLPQGRLTARLVKVRIGKPIQCRRRRKVGFHFAIILKGWARFLYRRKETLVEAGDCVCRQPSGPVPYLFDYSPDMEYIEIVSAADSILHETQCASPRSTRRRSSKRSRAWPSSDGCAALNKI
jgi:hypothetical protein